MGYLSDEINAAIKRLATDVIELDHIKELRNNIMSKYVKGENHEYLWEGFIDRVSIQDRDAWKWIDEFVTSETIMFFNECDETRAYVFKNGSDVVDVIGDTYGYEFYLTNKQTDYLICFNHHDYLIACGSAKSWLKSKKIIHFNAY